MHFTCERDNLNAALSIVQKALPARTTLNALEGVYMEAKESQLCLRCCDLTLQIDSTIPAQVQQEGEIVLGKLLFEVVRHLPSGEMEIKTVSENTARLTSNRSKVTLQSMPCDDYPQLLQLRAANEVNLPCSVFKDMIKQTIFSVSTTDVRPILTGVLLELTKEGVHMVAMDGYRLALRKYPMPCAQEAKLVIPAKSLNEIARILGDEEDVKLMYGGGYASVRVGDTTVCTQLFNGEYMNYRQLITGESQTRMIIERQTFLDSLERASVMAREAKNNLTKLGVKQDKLIITSNSELGETYDEIPTTLIGHELDIAFNVRFLTDVLKALSDEELAFHFNTNTTPCLIRPKEGDDFLYIVLPVRIYA
jgi:DNA polymerase-3 subunit beta